MGRANWTMICTPDLVLFSSLIWIKCFDIRFRHFSWVSLTFSGLRCGYLAMAILGWESLRMQNFATVIRRIANSTDKRLFVESR